MTSSILSYFVIHLESKGCVLYGRLAALHPNFVLMSDEQKLRFILCPPTIDIAKCASKLLGIMTNIRKEIDDGFCPLQLQVDIKHRDEIPSSVFTTPGNVNPSVEG